MANRKTAKKKRLQREKEMRALDSVRDSLTGGNSNGNSRDVQSSRK